LTRSSRIALWLSLVAWFVGGALLIRQALAERAHDRAEAWKIVRVAPPGGE